MQFWNAGALVNVVVFGVLVSLTLYEAAKPERETTWLSRLLRLHLISRKPAWWLPGTLWRGVLSGYLFLTVCVYIGQMRLL